MASILKHLRSSTADKRPVASGLADGQIAINTASGTPAMFFKDSNGGVVKVGPAHVGAAAPNAVPAGSAGNSLGELWVDNSLTTPGLNYYTGSAFVNLTPSGTTAAVGLVELATPAETQTGTDGVRAVTPSGLQSKVSDSTSTTSSTTIASSTAVKSAYDLANAALPKAGGTVTGELLIGTTGSLVFEGSSDDSFETTIAVTNPTADHTITFPNVTGAVVTTGDSGTVTSTMIANDTIVNADINSAAAIVDTKLATISTADKVSVSALNIDGATDIGGALENGDLFIVDDGAGGTNRKAPAFRMAQLTYSGVTGDITIASGGTSAIGAGVIVDADVNASAAIAHSKLANITAGSVLLGNATNVPTATALTGDVTVNSSGVTAISSGVIVNADVNASAAIAGTKISPDFGSQTITTTGVVSAALGAAATPSITFTGDLNTGIYSPGADQVAISTNGTGRLFVDASGVVGINGISTGSASDKLQVLTGGTASDGLGIYGTFTSQGAEQGAINFYGATNAGGPLASIVNVDNRATSGSSRTGSLVFKTAAGGANDERARITSDGKLLVGTSTSSTIASADFRLQIEGTTYSNSGASFCTNSTTAFQAPYLALARSRGTTAGSNTIVQSGDALGYVVFCGADGNDKASEAARIDCLVDGTPGTNDMPGRLVFSTTADGASSPTERMRIGSDGNIYFGKTTTSTTVNGIFFQDVGSSETTAVAVFTNTEASDAVANIICNRQNSDGRLVQFRQANTTEGTISVSGTTVTYGGGHLARWSQLPNEENPADILKGTVMSNLDEMCEWGEENNEQLNKTKVSDVEGDPNVAGVFVSTSFDEDGPLDFFVAMTGDMIIRIAEGVTVQRGDLLMSAGDGTAKPQDDDIIRSKTVAKVTSTHVTCTYDDGSYCVPCVLMAC